jgi:hypothetical protein
MSAYRKISMRTDGIAISVASSRFFFKAGGPVADYYTGCHTKSYGRRQMKTGWTPEAAYGVFN